MTKIAMLCPRTIRTHFAGIENHILHLSKALNKAGFDIEIFATSKRPLENVRVNGIKVREFPAFAPSEAYFFSPQLYLALRKTDADIVHCNGYNNLVTFAGLIAKKKNQKLIVTLHSSGPSSAFRKFLWKPYTFLFNLLAKRIDLVICVSEFERKEFMRKLRIARERFIVIPNGVDGEFIKEAKTKKTDSIISIGRLVRNKGFHRIIRAMPLVLKQFPKLKLRIVGDGPFREALESIAREIGVGKSVEFTGFIPLDKRNSLIRMLREAKAFIFLSDYEAQGIVISEAVATGTPTIVSEKGVMKEFIEKQGAVGVKNPEDEKEVAEKIISVLKNPERFKPDSSDVWSWERVVRETVCEFKRFVAYQ